MGARAYRSVIDYLLQFSTSRIFEGKDSPHPRTTGASVGFVWKGHDDPPLQHGDLVLMSCAPASKWRIAWYEGEKHESGWDHYLLRSVEDDEQCWWTNVSLSYLHRPTLAQHPEWRWSDEEYAFNDRWNHACYKLNDAFLYRPVYPDFHGKDAIIQTRARHDFHTFRAERLVKNFANVGKRKLSSLYKEMQAEHEAQRSSK